MATVKGSYDNMVDKIQVPSRVPVARRSAGIDVDVVNKSIGVLGLVAASIRDGELRLNFMLSQEDLNEVNFETLVERLTVKLDEVRYALPGITSISVG